MTVWNIFPFLAEFDALDVRLHELADVVDYFVLLEATLTHSGHPKPLRYQGQAARFAPFASKIIPTAVDISGIGGDHEREAAHRDRGIHALASADPDDLVILSDADEIPRASVIADLRASSMAHGTVLGLESVMLRYFVNWVAPERWPHPNVMTLATARQQPLTTRRYTETRIVPDGGWHFTSFGGPEAVRDKLASFMHQEAVRPEHLDPGHIEDCIGRGVDCCGNWPQAQWIEASDANLPRWLVSELVAGRYQGWLHPQRRTP